MCEEYSRSGHLLIPDRLGELLIPSRNTFDPERHVARSVKIAFSEIAEKGRYASFHIPWTKTTKRNGADVVLTDVDVVASPTLALRHHLNANADVPPHAPLFAYEMADGGWAPMTRDWFLARVNEVWRGADLGELTGHCFRIGGTTELLLRGTSPDVVATLGSWESRAFLKYWRRIEQILPLFILQASDAARITIASASIQDWKRRKKLKDPMY